MSDTIIEQNEVESLGTEISDEVLEAAGSAECFAAYTQFAYCTQMYRERVPSLAAYCVTVEC